MAIDKAVDSSVLDAGLTSVADAIRAKTGGTDLLAFPEGMVEAIGGISGGGGGGDMFETSASAAAAVAATTLVLAANMFETSAEQGEA